MIKAKEERERGGFLFDVSLSQIEYHFVMEFYCWCFIDIYCRSNGITPWEYIRPKNVENQKK